MTDPRDMTTGEAEAWRAGWRAAQEAADALCAMVGRYPALDDNHPIALSYRAAAGACWAHVRAMQPPAAITNPPGRALEGS